MTRRKFDFVLGSVHAFRGTWAGARDILQKYSADEIFEMHYSETLEMVQFGGFDALAHMDFPRRFVPEYKEPPDLIDSIFTTIIQCGNCPGIEQCAAEPGKRFFPAQPDSSK